jgi:hypothetical protein
MANLDAGPKGKGDDIWAFESLKWENVFLLEANKLDSLPRPGTPGHDLARNPGWQPDALQGTCEIRADGVKRTVDAIGQTAHSGR